MQIEVFFLSVRSQIANTGMCGLIKMVWAIHFCELISQVPKNVSFRAVIRKRWNELFPLVQLQCPAILISVGGVLPHLNSSGSPEFGMFVGAINMCYNKNKPWVFALAWER